MTPRVDLDALDALNATRTPGEWRVRDGDRCLVEDHRGDEIAECGFRPAPAPNDECHGNTAAIVALVNSYPAMAAELRELRPKPKPALPVLSLPVVEGMVWRRAFGCVKHHLKRGEFLAAQCGEWLGNDARDTVVKGSRPCPACLAIAEGR